MRNQDEECLDHKEVFVETGTRSAHAIDKTHVTGIRSFQPQFVGAFLVRPAKLRFAPRYIHFVPGRIRREDI
jgi:hypothetical protein